jgi:hypothetical protein
VPACKRLRRRWSLGRQGHAGRTFGRNAIHLDFSLCYELEPGGRSIPPGESRLIVLTRGAFPCDAEQFSA